MKGEVCISLNDFDDDDILEAAVDIVEHHIKKEVPKDGWALGRYKNIDQWVDKLRLVLCAKPATEDELSLPPPSTAARIKSASELRAYLESLEKPKASA